MYMHMYMSMLMSSCLAHSASDAVSVFWSQTFNVNALEYIDSTSVTNADLTLLP